MDLSCLKRPPGSLTECKKLKCFNSSKDILTTDANTQEIRVLSKFKFNSIVNPIPLELFEGQEEVDVQIIELMDCIKQQNLEFLKYSQEFSEIDKLEEELLSRVSERKDLLDETTRARDKILNELGNQSKDISALIKACENEIDNNHAQSRLLACNVESAQGSISTLNQEITAAKSEILELNEKYLKAAAETLNTENLMQKTSEKINFYQSNISNLVDECTSLHKIYLIDQESMLKIKDDISKFNN
jgi:chromosome segregation ATPase